MNRYIAYCGLNCETCGEIPNLYRSGITEYLMAKSLKE